MPSAFVLASVLSILGIPPSSSPDVLGAMSFGAPRIQVRPREPHLAAPAREPYVVCGLTVVPIDPSIDPKFTPKVPKLGRTDEPTQPTIRRFSTGLCRHHQ